MANQVFELNIQNLRRFFEWISAINKLDPGNLPCVRIHALCAVLNRVVSLF